MDILDALGVELNPTPSLSKDTCGKAALWAFAGAALMFWSALTIIEPQEATVGLPAGTHYSYKLIYGPFSQTQHAIAGYQHDADLWALGLILGAVVLSTSLLFACCKKRA